MKFTAIFFYTFFDFSSEGIDFFLCMMRVVGKAFDHRNLQIGAKSQKYNGHQCADGTNQKGIFFRLFQFQWSLRTKFKECCTHQ